VTIKILSHELAQTCCEILIEDLADCQLFAEQVASLSTTPMAIALSGTLGAGKTQWTRFFAIALGAQPTSVSSPTFMLVHEYDSQPPIYHLDAYRIGDEDEMLELGIEEMLDADAITIVEWADRFPRSVSATYWPRSWKPMANAPSRSFENWLRFGHRSDRRTGLC